MVVYGNWFGGMHPTSGQVFVVDYKHVDKIISPNSPHYTFLHFEELFSVGYMGVICNEKVCVCGGGGGGGQLGYENI